MPPDLHGGAPAAQWHAQHFKNQAFDLLGIRNRLWRVEAIDSPPTSARPLPADRAGAGASPLGCTNRVVSLARSELAPSVYTQQ
ncbi:hypothetical protein VTN02DRAFT_5651 [Thermoascus thermophilus]